MPETVHVGAEIPPEIRDAADKVFYDFGVTISEAICLMISRTVKDKCPPFDIKAALLSGAKYITQKILMTFFANSIVERNFLFPSKEKRQFVFLIAVSYCCAPTMRV